MTFIGACKGFSNVRHLANMRQTQLAIKRPNQLLINPVVLTLPKHVPVFPVPSALARVVPPRGVRN